MLPWTRRLAPLLLTALLVPSVGSTQGESYTTQLLVNMGDYTLRFAWDSADGAFQSVGWPGCHVAAVHVKSSVGEPSQRQAGLSQTQAGYFWCQWGSPSIDLRSAALHGDGSTTYVFIVRGSFGTDRILLGNGGDGIHPVGFGAAQRFELKVTWIHARSVSSDLMAVESAVVEGEAGCLESCQGVMPGIIEVVGPGLNGQREAAAPGTECFVDPCYGM